MSEFRMPVVATPPTQPATPASPSPSRYMNADQKIRAAALHAAAISYVDNSRWPLDMGLLDLAHACEHYIRTGETPNLNGESE